MGISVGLQKHLGLKKETAMAITSSVSMDDNDWHPIEGKSRNFYIKIRKAFLRLFKRVI